MESRLMQMTQDVSIEHSIHRCLWETRYDGNTQEARRLQDTLSHWTQHGFKSVLSELLDDYCPAGYHWHIDQLILELGTIDEDKLAVELPKRVKEALTIQLQQPPVSG